LGVDEEDDAQTHGGDPAGLALLETERAGVPVGLGVEVGHRQADVIEVGHDPLPLPEPVEGPCIISSSRMPSGRTSSTSSPNVPSTRTNATRATASPRLAQAWSVPRWMTTSPARAVTSLSSRTRVISPSSTMP